MYGWPERIDEAGVFAFGFWSAFLGVLLALVGFSYLVAVRRRLLFLIVMFALPQVAFFINYAAIDKETMFLSAYLLGAVLVGVGISVGFTLLAGFEWFRARSILAGTLGLLILALIAINLPLVDVSGDYRARDRAEQFFAAAEADTIAIGWWTDLAPLEYLQTIDGERPDVRLVHTWAHDEQQLRALVRTSLKLGQPVYVLREHPWTEPEFDAFSEDYWYRLERAEYAERESLNESEQLE